MLSFNRVSPSVQRALARGFNQSLQSGHNKQVAVVGCRTVSDSAKSWKMKHNSTCIEGYQGDIRDMSVSEARHVLKQASEYQAEGPSIQGTQSSLSQDDIHSSVLDGLSSHISLHGCMQSTVPTPQQSSDAQAGYGSYLNMPGGGEKLLDKYLSHGNQFSHPSKQFSTSARVYGSQQGAQSDEVDENDLNTDPTPQGIQGDNCVDFKLWMENCQRYNLPNCDEQLEALKVGRKTLAEVFQEQQEIIRIVAESYKKKFIESSLSDSSEQSDLGSQEYFHYNFAFDETPCPQGLQGDDCATYRAWSKNCKTFGFHDCEEKLREVEGGRKTLQDIFDEQTEAIRNIVSDYQQKRPYSTSSQVDNSDKMPNSSPHSIPPSNDNSKLTSRQKLKRAVKEYGSTVVIFHVGISLMSLGGFYVLVSR